MPKFDPDRIQAVLFDVDGTLYDQRPLRLYMMRALLGLPLRRGIGGTRRALRAISAFRHTLEALREAPPGSNLASLRFSRAAERAGLPEAELREIVGEWIYQRPLPWMRGRARPGAAELMGDLRRLGRRVGVLSDYPTGAKLEALGLGQHVALRLCCEDPDIDALKPHPQGFLRACQIWQLPPAEVLYVGDRVSVDAAGAAAAGMPCAIVDRSVKDGPDHVGVPDFSALQRLLLGD